MELNKEFTCIKSNSLIHHKQINLDKSYQETLEDYLDDIVRIVKCTSHSFITACSINDGIATIAGKIEIQLTYQNNNKELLYTDFIEEFEERLDVSNSSDKAFCNGFSYDKYCSYRLINQRRIDFHISSQIEASIYDELSFPSISKCDGLRLKSNKYKCINIQNSIQSKLEIDETFDLPSTSNGISRIASFETNVKNIDSKAITDKVFIKAQIELFVLYSDNDNILQKANYSFEASKIIDISSANDQSSIITTIKKGNIYIKAKSGAGDNSGNIELYGDFSANVKVLNEEEIDISTDGYIIGYETENDYSNLEIVTDNERINSSYNLKTKIGFTKDFKEIVSITVQPISLKQSAKKVMLEFSAKAFVRLDDDSYDYLSTTKEIECFDCSKSLVSSSVIIESSDFSIESNQAISLNIHCKIDAITGNQKQLKLLNDIKCSKKSNKNSALTLYFASKDENLWNIAKKFSSDTKSIMIENKLTKETLEHNQALLIPGM